MKLMVTTAPAGTVMVFLSKARFCALRLIVTAVGAPVVVLGGGTVVVGFTVAVVVGGKVGVVTVTVGVVVGGKVIWIVVVGVVVLEQAPSISKPARIITNGAR